MALEFYGRRAEEDRKVYGDRLPPGQKLTDGWPVLHYGGIPRIDINAWRFHMAGLVEEEVSFTWDEFMALPQTSVVCDIHCVTRWSKFDNEWQGVAIKDLLKRVKLRPNARHVMIHSYGGYTTNIPLVEFAQDDVMLAHTHNGKPLTPDHGWPLRLVLPRLYFWKSAKWVRGFVFMEDERPGFWEQYGYHIHGDPWKEERYA